MLVSKQIKRPIYMLLGVAALAAAASAQEAADFFGQNCISCHTVGGGRLTGPDLKNVTQRKERAWLIEFLQSPQAMLDKGDPYALKLQQEARGVVMPNINGMSKDRAAALLTMLDAESKLAKSQFAGMQISDRPFTSHDIAQGRAVFLGERGLLNGGPACISCHTVKGNGALGGGRLGPDLTRVYERLQGRKNIAAWYRALSRWSCRWSFSPGSTIASYPWRWVMAGRHPSALRTSGRAGSIGCPRSTPKAASARMPADFSRSTMARCAMSESGFVLSRPDTA
jgi:mono/diheme cytochrome c family protein